MRLRVCAHKSVIIYNVKKRVRVYYLHKKRHKCNNSIENIDYQYQTYVTLFFLYF